MTVLIIGTAGSGKSAFAEKIAEDAAGPCGRLYYLATMKIMDDEGRKRVVRHRKMREGKGFETIEMERGIERALLLMESPEESTVLLECVSNLAGNEMHDGELGLCMTCVDADNETGHEPSMIPAEKVDALADHIASSVRTLARSVGNLIIVTNEYELPGGCDDMTRAYIKLLGLVNERIKGFSDTVYDLREGVPR